jgi:hypothetical protein
VIKFKRVRARARASASHRALVLARADGMPSGCVPPEFKLDERARGSEASWFALSRPAEGSQLYALVLYADPCSNFVGDEGCCQVLSASRPCKHGFSGSRQQHDGISMSHLSSSAIMLC